MNQKNLSPSSWFFKISVLSLSILAMTAPSISIANNLLQKTFTQQSTAEIEMISTLPNFGVLLLILFADTIANKFGIKRTIMAGLLMYLLGGVLPAFIPNYYAIVFLRFLMGCGIGLFNPFSVSLMYRFYKDQELSDMLGFQNTGQNLGNAGFSFLLGALVLAGWKVTFMGYFIALIPLILFGAFVVIPDDQPTTKKERPKLADSINGHILLLALLFLIIFGMFMMMTIKMALFGAETGLISASAASSILAVLGLSSMFSAIAFGKLSKRVGNFMLPISLTGIAMGFFIVASASNAAMVVLGVIIAGIFFGWVFPQAFLRAAQVGPKEGGTLTTSVILMGINLGAFLSPSVVNFVANLLGNKTAASVLAMCGWGFALLAILEYLYTFFNQRT
ncbi:MFS transporter [Streptococcus mutans]|uniref:MFS transporter n=1 Tax=Streptococcus mutans TaxID=1309 RepID=UPI0002E17503|nr:MFS transporter [Streptococcus mutans]